MLYDSYTYEEYSYFASEYYMLNNTISEGNYFTFTMSLNEKFHFPNSQTVGIHPRFSSEEVVVRLIYVSYFPSESDIR